MANSTNGNEVAAGNGSGGDVWTGTEHEESTAAEVFRWHGTALIYIPLMMVTGIVGNSLVLYITHFRWKNSIFSFFIKVLAWLDLSNLLVALPPLLVLTVDGDIEHFDVFCNVTTWVALFTALTSALVLVVIAANRFRKLCHPQSKQVTLQLANKLTVGCFVFGAATATPSVWLFGKDTVAHADTQGHHPVNISYCFIKTEADLSLMLVWAVVMGGTFMAVTVALVTLYGFIIRSLRLHDQRMANVRRPSGASTASKNVFKKHTLVFIMVTLLFFLTYFPYFITVILLMVDRTIEGSMGPVAKAFFDMAKLFPLLSNVCNPIIYSFTSERFKDECRKVFHLRPCRALVSGEQTTATNTASHSHEMSQSEGS